MGKFHTLSIKEIIRETERAVSLVFDVPTELKNEFSFKAGQYITIKSLIQGKEVRRAYSICSAPNSDELKVTIKEVNGGVFSGLANNKMKAGDVLEVHPPEGKFILEPELSEENNYAAFAAGSGITPVLSIIKTVLLEEKNSRFYLVYGNKTPQETIFFKELLDLQSQYAGRLFIEFVYSQTQEENAHFGRIDNSTVNYILKNAFENKKIKTFYLCGPEEMIKQVSSVLNENGVQEEQIKYELFSTQDEGSVESTLDGNTTVTVTVDDEEKTFVMPQSSSILDAALEQGMDVPYSCQGGICSSCVARIIEGTAEMKKNQILTDGEIAEGLILTCQAHPTTSVVKVDYDDV
ncbi:MAG TPA: ferredoxin--NADP reductase [Salinimicrobium sp.]|nr:ferredoxin--NADP reductase [Salinimicrobium sp.]